MSEEWKPFIECKNTRALLQGIAKNIDRRMAREGVVIGPDVSSIFSIFSVTRPTDIKVVILVEKNQRIYNTNMRAYTNAGIVYSTVKTALKSPMIAHLHEHVRRSYENAVIPPHGELTDFCSHGIFMMPIYWTMQKTVDASSESQVYEPHVFWRMFSIAVLEYIYMVNKDKDPVIVLAGKGSKDLWQQGEMKRCNYRMVFTSSMTDSAFIESTMVQDINRHMKAAGHQLLDWNNIFNSTK